MNFNDRMGSWHETDASVLLNFDNRIGSWHGPSCRDNGRMWGRVGALCLSWSECDSVVVSRWAWPDHPAPDKHKAPSSALPHPLSLQDAGAASVPTRMIPLFGCQKSSGGRGCQRPAKSDSHIRLSKFIRSHANYPKRLAKFVRTEFP